VSALGFQLASPDVDRAPWRERLEQGLYGHVFAGLRLSVEADTKAGFSLVRASLQRLSQIGVRRVTLATREERPAAKSSHKGAFGSTDPLLKPFFAP
jgi:hypothetical protein